MRIRNLYISVICLSVFLLTACASGSSIVTGTTRAPIDPSQVTLYIEPPEKYEIIGVVKASSDSGWTEQDSQDYAVAELKNQAAKLGANGVLLTSTGVNTSTVVGTYSTGMVYAIPVTAQTLSGKAIYISK